MRRASARTAAPEMDSVRAGSAFATMGGPILIAACVCAPTHAVTRVFVSMVRAIATLGSKVPTAPSNLVLLIARITACVAKACVCVALAGLARIALSAHAPTIAQAMVFA